MTDLKTEIKPWYIQKFPEDKLGLVINGKVTFMDIFDTLNKKTDIYKTLGVGDSVIRERVFEGLEEAVKKAGKNISYRAIYEAWLNMEPIKES